MTPAPTQNKTSEISFFDSHGASNAYDVFAPETNEKLIDIFVRLTGLPPGARVVDLGCGSGVFTNALHRRGYRCVGVDLSPKLLDIAREKFPDIEFVEGDIENLPFEDNSFDGVLLSGVLHHLPELSRCAAEVKRCLKPGGKYVAFDPNRMNPFMYLYRDRSSPFYSSVGVTENERPVLAGNIARPFRAAGFKTGVEYHSGMKYRYIASGALRWLLPAYNLIDSIVFAPPFLKWLRAFVFSYGEKPAQA